MEPIGEPLSFFGRSADCGPLDWAWVRSQLDAAGTYWVVGRSTGPPHPRPVWGVWHDDALHLSVGGPVLQAQLVADPRVTVHLESGTDVVIVEGIAAPSDPARSVAAIERYDDKYDWSYVVDDYGPLTEVRPVTVLAWRSAGWAGRDGFQQAGRWRFS
jgi:hypothetical protein